MTWARSLIDIPNDHITIIKHVRKSLLFHNDKVWVKNNNQHSLFDVTMGSYDGAEVCELVGLFLLNKLAVTFGKDNVGLYRDDGLLILRGTGGRQADQARKKLHEIFKEHDLKVTAEINYHVVNFLDVTLNLSEQNYQPYRKPNNDPLYVDARSNHPPNIIKQIPLSINQRLSSLSSHETSFRNSLPVYEDALKRSKYKARLSYSDPRNKSQCCNSQRKRNIIWFNPPFSKNVKTNVAQRFLKLLDKHFPRSSKLHKIFNRNSVKVSYSCMPNVKSVISNHNRRILKSNKTSPDLKTCNCRVKSACPLLGKCLTKSLVYNAEITTTDTHESMNYIGITAGTFKDRFNNHTKSLNNLAYSNETELSKHAWNLKRQNRQFNIRWSIVKCVPAYSAGGRSCNLCLEEKMSILKSNKEKTLNKRTELFAKCRHKNKFSARNFKRVRNVGNLKFKM